MQSAMIYLLTIIHSFMMLNFLANSTEFINTHNDDTMVEIMKTTLCQSSGGSKPLGMESGAISDDDITASSSYYKQSVGPQNARLNKDLSGGAWCPSQQISADNSGEEWIQVNLSSAYVITAIATQGRFGNGVGVEFVESYLIEYTRDNGNSWSKWRDENGYHELSGNKDTYSVVKNNLSLPLVGITAIRLVPMSVHSRTCCLRFELYGCPYNDGPISYSMLDGQYNGRFGDLIDQTYDGRRSESGFLSGGLGQLIDGIKGHDNYKVNKGFEWIGWKANHNHISITFEFQDIRNFTLASFHCNNMFTKDMQVFSSAKIYFSFDGRNWSHVPEDFSYMPDHVVERARDVVIHLHHRVGRFIRFDLKFAANKWILISEVRIDSSPINHNTLISDLDLHRSHNKSGPIATAAINKSRSFIRESVLLIVFLVLGLTIAISMILYIIHARRRKEKLTGITMTMKDVATAPLYCEPQDVNRISSFSGTDPEYAVPDLMEVSPPSTIKLKHPKNPRYYASTDVLIRSNINDFDNHKYGSNTGKCVGYRVGNNYSDVETSVISTQSPPGVEPPLVSRTVTRVCDKDMSVNNGHFGYSRFNDSALGHIINNNSTASPRFTRIKLV